MKLSSEMEAAIYIASIGGSSSMALVLCGVGDGDVSLHSSLISITDTVQCDYYDCYRKCYLNVLRIILLYKYHSAHLNNSWAIVNKESTVNIPQNTAQRITNKNVYHINRNSIMNKTRVIWMQGIDCERAEENWLSGLQSTH